MSFIDGRAFTVPVPTFLKSFYWLFYEQMIIHGSSVDRRAFKDTTFLQASLRLKKCSKYSMIGSVFSTVFIVDRSSANLYKPKDILEVF